MKDFKVDVDGKEETWCFCMESLEIYIKIKAEIEAFNYKLSENYETFLTRMKKEYSADHFEKNVDIGAIVNV